MKGKIFLILVVVGFIYLASQAVPIRWNSKHPEISIRRQSSWWVNVYTTLLLGTGRNDYRSEQMEGESRKVRPQVIGVILSDKTRGDNKQEVGGTTRYSSTMTDINGAELLLYVYVSPAALSGGIRKALAMAWIGQGRTALRCVRAR